MHRPFIPLPLVCAALLAGCPQPATLAQVQDEVFTQSCAFSSCHGSGQEGELSLVDAATSAVELIGVQSWEQPGAIRVVAGDSAGSLLFQVLQGEVDPVRQMPVNGSVSDQQLELVRSWIDDGAPTE